MDKLHIQLLKMRLPIEKDEEHCKEIKDILDKDDEELAELYMKKYHKKIKEKREMIANALGIKIDEVIYDKAEKFISNNRNKFEIHSKTIEQFDIYGLNDYEIDFCYCDINIVISKGHSIYAEDINFKSLYFKNCKININVVDNFCCENIHFLNCDIYALNFNQVIIKGNIKFTNSNFIKKSVFNSCTFQDNIYFNNSIFQDFADFHECEFEKTACFYGVKFDKVPNFSQAQFKGSLNAVNAKLDFGFESLKEKIKQEHIEYNKRESIKKPLAHFANDFRDSFRIFKSTLIKDNNLLDASNFHKCELYCKEIELKESRHKRGINTNNNEDARKNIKPFKELIDFLLLRFYRNLCDHHTDFLKCFNNLVLLVALYAVLLWIGNFDLMQGKEPIISDILHQLGDKAITLKKDIKKYDWLVFLIFLALAVSCLYYLYKTIYLEHKLYIKNIKLILSFTKNSLKNICFFMLISVAIIFFYAAIIATLITLLNLNDMHYWQSYLNFISFVLFFVIYFSLISLDCVFVRFLLVIAAYIITSISIGKNIAILNPLIGKLLNTSIEIKDPIFQSITIAYTISTLLVLFSLQKTARKNSIVPN